jgi:hypothetical protein
VAARHEQVGDRRVVHALPDPLPDEGRVLLVDRARLDHLGEACEPLLEAGLLPQLREDLDPLLGREPRDRSRVVAVDVVVRRLRAQLEDPPVVLGEPRVLLVEKVPVAQRDTVVRGALEDPQLLDTRGDLGDQLHGRGAGADDAHATAVDGEAVRPPPRVAPVALEVRDPFEVREVVRGQHAHGRQHEPGPGHATVVEPDLPFGCLGVPARRPDPGVDLDVPAEVETVDDEVEVALALGLAREALLPAPLAQQLVGEGVRVGDALGVESGAWVAAPVPGASDAAATLVGLDAEAGLPQAVDRVDAGRPGTDHDGVDQRDLPLLRVAQAVTHAVAPIGSALQPVVTTRSPFSAGGSGPRSRQGHGRVGGRRPEERAAWASKSALLLHACCRSRRVMAMSSVSPVASQSRHSAMYSIGPPP